MELPHESHLLNMLLTEEGREVVKRCFAQANIIPAAAGVDEPNIIPPAGDETIESIAEGVKQSLQFLNQNIVDILKTLTTASLKFQLLATIIRAQHPTITLDTTGFYPPGQPYDASAVAAVSGQPISPSEPYPGYVTPWDPYAYTSHE